MKKKILSILPYIAIIITVVFIRSFLVTPVRVDGSSMYPTLKENDILLLNKTDKTYNRFDIIVISYNKTRIVKRVIGLPGETIAYKKNRLYINGKYSKEEFLTQNTEDFSLENIGYTKIPKGYYFVMGDNRSGSLDSRMIGLIPSKKILGTTNFTLFPLNRFGTIQKNK